MRDVLEVRRIARKVKDQLEKLKMEGLVLEVETNLLTLSDGLGLAKCRLYRLRQIADQDEETVVI